MMVEELSCNNLTAIKNLFEEESQRENLITAVRTENQRYIFTYEDNTEQAIDTICFALVVVNEEDWVVSLVYSDSSRQQPR